MKTTVIGAAIGLAVIAAAAGVANAGSVRSGTETIKGTTTANPSGGITVHASGVFTATGIFKIPSTDKATTVHWVFPRGTLSARSSAVSNGPLHLNSGTCAASEASYVSYVISPRQSTGAYAGATGHGHAVVTWSADFPRRAGGACDFGQNVNPKPGTERETLFIQGPLTLR
jgi:hypothetical protein